MKIKKEPYGLTAAFERVVATTAFLSPKFYAQVGYAVDPDCLVDLDAKLILRAVRAIAQDLGRPSESPVVVLQRIRRWVQEGTTTFDQLQSASDMLDAVEDAGLPSTDEVKAELVPILKRRMEREALDTAFAQYQNKGDLSILSSAFDKVQRLGEHDTDLGTVLGADSFEQIERLKQIERLPTGILEIDDALGGGMYRGCEGVWCANSGGGKSMALIQNATHAAMLGHFVAMPVLELPVPIILARLKSNMTGIPIDRILMDPKGCGAVERLNEIQSRGGFGRIVVKDFSPMTTTVSEITDWVVDVEKEHGEKVTVLVVDYADKCIAPRKSDESSYVTGKLVYEGFRLWAHESRRWFWTASAAKGREDKKGKRLGQADTADSINKVRVADLWITINPSDAGMSYFFAKNRLGKADMTVGPIPSDFECARIAQTVGEDA